jgi:Cytochrome c oxidase subunit Vb
MNDPIEHATGIEKRELLAKAAGNENPFDMKVLKRGPGTKDTPNLIPSAFDARLVGCICEMLLITSQYRTSNIFHLFRRGRTNIRQLDVALSRTSKEMRVRPLVQISREGSSLNNS